ncbi:MAG: thiol peroxidase [Ezakiella sp.]|nr:thiol peroxidase [Ezakiella sp.]MDD7472500.1 thiol peroxidase [Bacillota bacterium]MDY3923257.1 thiol peroxidase [Ezakiella sp.]
MEERKNIITFMNEPVTLLGKGVNVGDKAEDFKAIKKDMSEFDLSELKGKNILISVVPSIDTPVCEEQTKIFNKEASELKNIHLITISCDLPFAQANFCAAKGIENLTMLSDYRFHDFGEKYGFLIKELMLLARGIVIIDKDGVVQYVEYVPEVTNLPNFDKALEAAKAL